jgi:hypothetical protein
MKRIFSLTPIGRNSEFPFMLAILIVLFISLILSIALDAQDLDINDAVTWNANGQSMYFNASFEAIPTGAIIPGSTIFWSYSDPWALGPFTLMSNSGSFYDFESPTGDWIQIGNEYGGSNGIVFPDPGVYGSMDTVLLCPNGCGPAFNGGGYIPADGGTLTVTDPVAVTPEPSEWILLGVGMAVLLIVELIRRA